MTAEKNTSRAMRWLQPKLALISTIGTIKKDRSQGNFEAVNSAKNEFMLKASQKLEKLAGVSAAEECSIFCQGSGQCKAVDFETADSVLQHREKASVIVLYS